MDYTQRNLLVSGAFLEELARRYFPNSRIIIAERVFSGSNLEDVILIPRGELVLVVNFPAEVVFQSIEDLRVISINHLRFVPYVLDEEADVSGIGYAIAFGYEPPILKTIPNVINVGKRIISFGTFEKVRPGSAGTGQAQSGQLFSQLPQPSNAGKLVFRSRLSF